MLPALERSEIGLYKFLTVGAVVQGLYCFLLLYMGLTLPFFKGSATSILNSLNLNAILEISTLVLMVFALVLDFFLAKRRKKLVKIIKTSCIAGKSHRRVLAYPFLLTLGCSLMVFAVYERFNPDAQQCLKEFLLSPFLNENVFKCRLSPNSYTSISVKNLIIAGFCVQSARAVIANLFVLITDREWQNDRKNEE